MAEDRAGGIASFGVSFGNRKQGDSPGERAEASAFRIVVIAELVAGPDWSTGRAAPLDPVPIDAESFDRVMGQLGPSLAIEVADPFEAGDPPLRIDLLWRDRKAMRPGEMVEQVPALRALADARRVVKDVASRKLGADAARAQLTRILPRPSWADALVREVRPAPSQSDPVSDAEPITERRPAPAPARNGDAKPGGLDALLDMVDVTAAPESVAPPTPVQPTRSEMSRVVAAVARSARPGGAPAPPRALVGTALQRLEGAFRNLLESIVRHPEVRRLESTWRGLRLLVEHCDRRAGVEVDVLCAGADAVTDALGRLADAEASRPPVDLLLVDQRIDPVAADLARLEKWAGMAEALLAPLVVGGRATMVGIDSLALLARTTSAVSSSDDGRAVAVRAMAARETSRWVAIVLNDPLVRAPYTASTSRQQDPPFEEDPTDGGAYVFADGAYLVGALCARSHARLQWPTAITGGRDGAIGNLPVHTLRERGEEAAIPLQVLPTEDAVREVARAGLTMLACAPNTDAALLSRAPVLHRSSAGDGAAASTLADQLFVGRFARAVQQVAAAIPSGTEPRAAEEVARIALAQMFERAPPAGPEIIAKVNAAHDALVVTVRPRRFAGIGLEELTLGAALG